MSECTVNKMIDIGWLKKNRNQQGQRDSEQDLKTEEKRTLNRHCGNFMIPRGKQKSKRKKGKRL